MRNVALLVRTIIEGTYNVNLATERNQMVFAQGKDVNVSNDDHLICVFGKQSIICDFLRLR